MRLIAAALALVAPVPGEVTRPFSYGPDPFERGRHRGADLAAEPGAAVVAPCGGVVAHAGAVPGGSAVSLVCGPWRVSLLGVAPGVREGSRVRAGAPLGRALPPPRGHRGLHLGVRPAHDRLGYVDPLALIPALPPPAPAAPPARRPPRRPRPTAPRPTAPRLTAPRLTAPRPLPAEARRPVLWPLAAGILAVAASAAGLRVRIRRRAAAGTPVLLAPRERLAARGRR